jgi:hypothetical protein
MAAIDAILHQPLATVPEKVVCPGMAYTLPKVIFSAGSLWPSNEKHPFLRRRRGCFSSCGWMGLVNLAARLDPGIEEDRIGIFF